MDFDLTDRVGVVTGGSRHPAVRHRLQLDKAEVTFVEGPIDSLIGVTLAATDRSRAGETHTIGGVTFTLV